VGNRAAHPGRPAENDIALLDRQALGIGRVEGQDDLPRTGVLWKGFQDELVTSRKAQFRWRNPETNPYIPRDEERNTVTSRYHDVAMAMSHA